MTNFNNNFEPEMKIYKCSPKRCRPCYPWPCYPWPWPPYPPVSSISTALQIQLQQSALGTIAYNDTVLFDTTLFASSPNFSYNPITGIITVNSTGLYSVSWWVSTDGTQTVPSVSFDVEVNGTAVASGSSPIVTGQVNGTAIVDVTSPGTQIKLTNSSEATVRYANTNVQANLVITEA